MNWLIGTVLAAGLTLDQPAPPTPEAVMEVPVELTAQVNRAVLANTPDKTQQLEKLVDFFHGGSGLGFEYVPRPTRSVADTYATKTGNCLAFTLAFMAVARQAGLDAYPREVRIQEQWQRMGASVLSIGHVNVGVDTPQRDVIVDFSPDLMEAHRLAQPYRGGRISDERALAHFYNNRAVELLIEGQPLAAQRWIDQALALDDGFAPAWITRGIAARRTGQLEMAESAFLAALERDERSANALFNLVSLQRKKGDRAEMVRYGRRLEALDPDDPYLLWELGRLQRDLDEPELARESLEQAVRLTEGTDPMLVTGLVEVLFELGAYDKAREYLTRSIERIAPAKDSNSDLARLLEFKKQL